MAFEKHIEELVDILKREVRSFTAVQELLILEQKCLVDCDTQGLAGVLEKMEDIFTSISCLEKSRMDIIVKISNESGDSDGEWTVTRIADYTEGSLKRELLDTGHILTELNSDIQRRKATNTMLINQSIMLVESDIRTILNALNLQGSQDQRYQRKSGKGGMANGVCIDQIL